MEGLKKMINFIENEITTDVETELMILDTPVELVIEHIRSQMTKTYGSINYINPIQDKLNFVEEEYMDDPDTLFKVNEMRVLVFSEVASIIKEVFDVDVNIDYSNPKFAEEVVSDLYSFFVVNVRKNTFKVLLNYIKENKKDIISALDLNKPKKDVTTMSVKKKLKTPDVKIISNLYDVVDYIMGLEIEDAEFISYTRNESMLDLYNRGIISGAVAENFVEFVKDNLIVHDVIPQLFNTLKENE